MMGKGDLFLRAVRFTIRDPHAFFVVHIDGFLNGMLNGKNPVGVILVRGVESVADGVDGC